MTDDETGRAALRAEIEEFILVATYPFAAEARQTGKFVFWDDERIHQKDLDLLVIFAEKMGLANLAELDGAYGEATGWSSRFFRRLGASLQDEGTDHWASGPSTPYLLVLVAAYALQASLEDLEAIGWDAGQAKTILRLGAETVGDDRFSTA